MFLSISRSCLFNWFINKPKSLKIGMIVLGLALTIIGALGLALLPGVGSLSNIGSGFLITFGSALIVLGIINIVITHIKSFYSLEIVEIEAEKIEVSQSYTGENKKTIIEIVKKISSSSICLASFGAQLGTPSAEILKMCLETEVVNPLTNGINRLNFSALESCQFLTSTIISLLKQIELNIKTNTRYLVNPSYCIVITFSINHKKQILAVNIGDNLLFKCSRSSDVINLFPVGSPSRGKKFRENIDEQLELKFIEVADGDQIVAISRDVLKNISEDECLNFLKTNKPSDLFSEIKRNQNLKIADLSMFVLTV